MQNNKNNFLSLSLIIILVIVVGYFSYSLGKENGKVLNNEVSNVDLKVSNDEDYKTKHPIINTKNIDTSNIKIPSDWKTYTDSEYNFSFKYPSSMNVIKSNSINLKGEIMSTIYSLSNSTNSNEYSYPNISIEYHLPPYGLQLYNGDLTSKHEGTVSTIKVLDRLVYVYSYVMSKDIKGNIYNPPMSITNVNFLDKAGTGSFFLTFKTLTPNDSTDIDIFNKVLSSFNN